MDETDKYSGAKNTIRQLRTARMLKLILILVLLTALPMLWRLSLFGDWANVESVVAWKRFINHYPGTFLWVVAAYLVASLVLFPITILNVATVLTFGPVVGNLYALIGWLASACMGFGLGRLFGMELVHRWLQPRVHRRIQQVKNRGFLAVLILRLVPLAPFTIVNIFVGASGIAFRDFTLASVVGRMPGVVILTLAGVQLEHFLRHPALGGLIILMMIVVVLPIVSRLLFKRWALSQASETRSG